MLKIKLVVMTAAAASLMGCSTFSMLQPEKTEPVVVKPSPEALVLAKIAEHAQRSSLSMQRLAALQAGRKGAKAVELVAPEGLDVPVTLNWTGPMDSLVKKIAEMTGYTYEGEIGSVPATSLNVAISVTETSAFKVLADIGAQAGSAADVVIRPDTRSMLVKYPPVTPNGGYVQAQ